MTEHGLEVILTHEHTDFDALASLLAASLLFPDAVPVLPGQLNRNVREFVALYRNQFPFVLPKELPRRPIRRIIMVDTNKANLPKGVRDETEILIIDHHRQEKEEAPAEKKTGKMQLWHEPLGANTTLLVEKISEQQIDLMPVQATLLALGIHEDTGSLTYASTTHRDARALAWLMEREQGVNLEVLHQFLRHPLSEAQRDLLETLIDNSEFHPVGGHTIVIAAASAPGFGDELSTLAHRLRDIHDADAIFLVVQLDELVQVVARSVSDEIDVGAVARQLGGGGHTRAAAAPVRGATLVEVCKRILDLIEVHSQPSVTVRHIMTSGRPQMIAPGLPVAEAHALMQRYGHEGFPVVARQLDGHEHLLGVLTRREADRAITHGLGDRPVRRFMQAGEITVRPTDSIPTLRQRMIESGWGQIPVVDEQGAIIGIVTRTDLIKLWDDTTPPERHADEIDRRLRANLAPAQLELLRLIGQEVEQLNFAVYIVGGFVRDLLLNSSSARLRTLDLDIVIEGDAIAFARHIQARYGGRVVTHKRFGTAKWILDDETQPLQLDRLLADFTTLPADNGAEQVAADLPTHLDFVTARTEFYTAPTVLPTVELSNIKLDLHRRDFTINTLAFSLNPDRWGELLDFFGGLNDLEHGLIRVLHSLSFVDDPTRILRAVRYEQRFGFSIEPRTLELLQDALELLDRVTPARVRHELERILQEALPEQALKRLAALEILERLDPALTVDEWVEDRFARLRTALQSPDMDLRLANEPIERLYWGMLVLRLPAATHAALQERLALRSETQRLMKGLAQLQAVRPQLCNPDLRPSVVVELLDPIDGVAQALYIIANVDAQVTAHLKRYYTEWRHIRSTLTGADLQRLGLSPSPLYGRILTALRAARLDGAVTTPAEELALAETIAREHCHD
ncbi:MAG: polynucleotide adenylyltransferase [Chloroflexi bacterium]|nr:MAG: polynucleotide adenylyltransferase [Chloroflexota bacterium]